jgi:hypothetical protein
VEPIWFSRQQKKKEPRRREAGGAMIRSFTGSIATTVKVSPRV